MGFTMRWHFIPIAAAALLALAGSGQAQSPSAETPPPAPTFQPLLEAPGKPLPPRPAYFRKSRRITNFTTGTDSQCIGDTTTPLCTVDTYFAWVVRSDPALDWIAPNFPSADPTAFAKPTPWFIRDYEILSLGPIKKSKLHREIKHWKPSRDTALAVIKAADCHLWITNAPREWSCSLQYGSQGPLYLRLKRKGNRWHVDYSFTPRY